MNFSLSEILETLERDREKKKRLDHIIRSHETYAEKIAIKYIRGLPYQYFTFYDPDPNKKRTKFKTKYQGKIDHDEFESYYYNRLNEGFMDKFINLFERYEKRIELFERITDENNKIRTLLENGVMFMLSDEELKHIDKSYSLFVRKYNGVIDKQNKALELIQELREKNKSVS